MADLVVIKSTLPDTQQQVVVTGEINSNGPKEMGESSRPSLELAAAAVVVGENIPEKKSFVKQYGGMTMALMASLFFSLALLPVKLLHTSGFTAQDASFWRYSGTMIPAIPIIIYFECGPGQAGQKHGSVFDAVWPLNRLDKWQSVFGLILRGIFGSSSVILRYYALQFLSIGDASVISFSSPILVTILAHFWLGERTGFLDILTALWVIVGVAIITRPPILTGAEEFDHNTLIGTAFATGSLVCSAMMTLITRKIRSVQFAVMMLAFGLIGVIESLILTMALDTGFTLPKGLYDTLLVAGVAGFSFIGQMTIILALKMETAGIVSLIRTCDVVFCFIIQFIFLGIVPDAYSSIGGSVVFFGILLTAFRKWLKTLPKEHRCGKIFAILLH